MIAANNSNDGFARVTMQAIGWNRIGVAGHERLHVCIPQYKTEESQAFRPLCPTQAGTLSPAFGEIWKKYPRQGLNSSADSAGNAAIPNRGGAESGAVGDENGILTVPDDPRLLWLIDAWPGLSEETRDAIARLAGDDVDDLAGVTATPDREAVS